MRETFMLQRFNNITNERAPDGRLLEDIQKTDVSQGPKRDGIPKGAKGGCIQGNQPQRHVELMEKGDLKSSGRHFLWFLIIAPAD